MERLMTATSESRVICLPVDASDYSTRTIQFAVNNIIKENDQIYLINVRRNCRDQLYLNPDENAPPYFITDDQYRQIDAYENDLSVRLMDTLAKPINAINKNVKKISVVGKDVRKTLDEKIEEIKPTIVIVGSRGLGLISRLRLGSVSQHMVHHCQSPVIVVP
ncbi:hypothetical protein BC833DRAFT_598183 [Globomyces pollinis-pini]|nr:hypothetical protein BC833DRAFT_598183 [Globomyces pollinis-pini]